MLIHTRLIRFLKYPNKVPKTCFAINLAEKKIKNNICDCSIKCKFDIKNQPPIILKEYIKNVYTIEKTF